MKMNNLHFYKYHGAGNDFIMIDNRKSDVVLGGEQIRFLCHRRFGVGGDGLVLLKTCDRADFEMEYYNSDGKVASMCGNAGRCVAAFANKLGLFSEKSRFYSYDGYHEAEFISMDGDNAVIKLGMRNISSIEKCINGWFLDTGSPHYVEFIKDVMNYPVEIKGRNLRYDSHFAEGSNVDFAEERENGIFVRTYERGVEAETLSCGTGVTASALVYAFLKQMKRGVISVKTTGGDFKVYFTQSDKGFENISLQGEACCVFEGDIKL